MSGPSLAVNEPSDAFEREADRVADQVMRMPDPGTQAADDPPAGPSRGVPSLQRKCACGGGASGCASCKAEDDAKLQRKAATPGGITTAPPVVHDVLRSPGKPIDAATRSFMEPRFGRDFGDVRIHNNAIASESARAVGARAYTVGSNIAFRDGEYRPGAESGRRLLAHELAHVVQQSQRQESARGHMVMRDVHETPPAQSPAAAARSKEGIEKVYATLIGMWERLSQSRITEADGDKIKAECAVFVMLIGERPYLYSSEVKRIVAEKLGVYPKKHESQFAQFMVDYGPGLKKFADDVGAEMAAKIASAPDPTATWLWVQEHVSEFLSDGGRGSSFNDLVEDKILGDYERKLAKELKKKPSELQEMADIQVSTIIDRFATNMHVGVTQAGAEFHLPMPLPGVHYNVAKAGSATTLLASELGEMFLKHSGKLVELGLHILPFATFAGEIFSIWREAQEERERVEKENKRGELEERAKHALFVAYDKTATSIQRRSDTLSVLVVGEALKRKIDPKAAGKHRLEDLVIEQLGFDEDVRDPAKVLEKASWKLRDASRELQKALSE